MCFDHDAGAGESDAVLDFVIETKESDQTDAIVEKSPMMEEGNKEAITRMKDRTFKLRHRAVLKVLH